MRRRPAPDPVAPGGESVWDYPRPPRLEPLARRIRVCLGGTTIADTQRAVRVLETSHPPTYYLPPSAIVAGALLDAPGASVCEWKGVARSFDVTAGGLVAPGAAWAYDRPTRAFSAVAGYVAFYAGQMDACMVDDELVVPQPGGFYGGWITAGVSGPFKGEPGSDGW